MVQLAPPAARQPGSDGGRKAQALSPRFARQVTFGGLRRYWVEVPVEPSLLPFLGLMLVGLVLRLWDLGAKALHHDESLHAVYSWYLYQGRGYVHDPMMHGPLLFEVNALVYLLFGASDVTARLAPALTGVVLIGLPWFLRRELGYAAALAAGALFAISPSFLYYSRFLRQDIYVDVFTLLMIIGVFRYLATGAKSWFYTAVVAAGLLFATKEDFYISGFIPFTFLVGCWFGLRGERRDWFRGRVRDLGWTSWAWGAAIFLVMNVVLYTTFFTNLRGLCTAVWAPPVEGCAGARGALQYWLDQQDYARGGQPWFYYLMLLPLYEFLPLALGAAALFLVRGKNFFFWFSVYWFVAATAIYSWAGEKMPWMLPQISVPLVLVAGVLLGQWVEAGWVRRALSARGAAMAGLVALIAAGLLAWVGLGAARTAGGAIEQQALTLQRLALSLMVAVAAGGLVTLGARWGGQSVKAGVALGLLLIGSGAYLRTSLIVNYYQPDTPNEPLVYVQSSPDVTWVADEIERIASQTGRGKDLPILMDNGWGDGTHESVAWPFEWYLRDYKNRRYFTKTIDPSVNLADYPVILAMVPNVEPIQEQLSQYNTQKYRLNWWFPEDYKQFAGDGLKLPLPGKGISLPTLRLDLIGQALSDPRNRLSLLRFLLYREAPGEKGAREFYFGVNRNIPALGPAPVGGSAAPVAAAAPPGSGGQAVAQTRADGSVVFGRTAEGQSILSDPKNAAVGPDGLLYVLEGAGARVTVFNPDGSVARRWGSRGAGDGQFQEPWGIAVAPNGDVYVADTWNHRIQRFDANGQFLGKWGRLADANGRTDADQGVFWGPRAIAISPSGEVYVTDTGNKRIQVFDLQGNFRRMFGGEGVATGQFREPTGLALDPQGNLLVADAWNRRVQRLNPNGGYLGGFQVSNEWENQAITNKPYLASAEGLVVATFPDAARAIVFDTNGKQVQQYQLPQGSSAVGVAVGPDRKVYLANSKGGAVTAYPLP